MPDLSLNRTSNIFKVGTFNVRGIISDYNKKCLADDLVKKYDLQILGIQETHLKGTGCQDIVTSDGKNNFNLFYNGADDNKYHGVGIVCNSTLKPVFTPISNRICKLTAQINDYGEGKNITFISAYAPTLSNSEKHPEERDQFYDDLENVINPIPRRNIQILGGDFNAKVGTNNTDLEDHFSKFGKGVINENGERLIETAVSNDLVISNTLFKHRLSHVATWVCPERINPTKTKDGEIRRNHIRNQIDYILLQNKFRTFIQNSRSYSGTITNTDHRLVVTTLKITWRWIYKQAKR